jgi:cellulose synthase operon protein C
MFALVRSLIGAGRIPEAEEFVQSAIKANPDNAVAYILEGVVALAQNKPSLAQKSFETSNAKDPGSPSGYLALAQMYYNQKNLNGAITTLSSSVDKVKENTGVRLALAGLYEAIGNFDDAIKQYEFMVEEDSSSAVAVNNLVSLITDNRDDVSSLKRAADLAIILRDSPIPQFKETLGWALVRNGDAKEGLKILEQTIGDLQNIGAAQYHLGAAYAKVGDKTLASKHLDLALQIEKNPVTLKKIKLIAETL